MTAVEFYTTCCNVLHYQVCKLQLQWDTPDLLNANDMYYCIPLHFFKLESELLPRQAANFLTVFRKNTSSCAARTNYTYAPFKPSYFKDVCLLIKLFQTSRRREKEYFSQRQIVHALCCSQSVTDNQTWTGLGIEGLLPLIECHFFFPWESSDLLAEAKHHTKSN